jgi:iron complex outermembrane recepter protein
MKTRFLRAPLAALPLAVLASFPSHAQTAASRDLPETVVTATRFNETLASLPLGVSVITAGQIRAAGATTVNEAVMKLLGVPGRQDFYGAGNYSLDLRGFGGTAGSNQVVVLDGIRLNEADLSGPRLAEIPIDAIERIEVLRGSGAVLYGEGASGGVIVITTKAGVGRERRNQASLYGALGTHSLRDGRASATLAGGGFSLDVAGQKRESDNHRQNFRSESDGAEFTGQWSNDWLRLGLRHGRDTLDTGLPGGLSAAQYAADPRMADELSDNASIDNERNGIFAQAEFGNWSLAGDHGWRDKTLVYRASYGDGGYGVEAGQTSLRARHSSTLSVGQNVLVLGHDRGRWTRQNQGTFGTSQARQTTRAWYIKDDLSLPGGMRLSAGWRTESLDKSTASGTRNLTDRLNAWDLGLSQLLAPGTTAWVRMGTSYRLANVDEFNYTRPGETLRPQTSRDLETGLRWARGAYQLEARLYRSAITDEIGFDPQAVGPGPFDGRNVNFDPTRRTGLELDGDWSVTTSLQLAARLAVRRSTFREGPYAGKDVPLVPRQTLALRADWKPAAGHRVGAGVTFVAAQKADFQNRCRIPFYATADARYAVQFKSAELSLGVNNLFDRNYYANAFDCTSGVTEGIYPEAGRTFTAALRVSF